MDKEKWLRKYKRWKQEASLLPLEQIRGDRKPNPAVRELFSRYTMSRWSQFLVRYELERDPPALDLSITTLINMKEGTFFKSTSGLVYGQLLHCNLGHATIIAVDRTTGGLTERDVAPGMEVVRIAPLQLRAVPKARKITGKVEVTNDNGDAKVSHGQKGGKRYDLFGYPITACIRWMASQAWSFEEARSALKELGLEVSDSTIRAQLSGWKKRGAPADLTEQQAEQLYNAQERGSK